MSKKPNARILAGDFVYVEKRGKKGLYCATWWRDGKHHRRTLDTRNKEEAIRRARRLESDIVTETDRAAPKKSVSIKDAIDKFLKHKDAEDCVDKTKTGYYGQLFRFVKFLEELGIENVNQVTTDNVILFRKERKHVYKNDVLSEKTKHNHLVLIKGFFKFCIEREWIDKNPATQIRAKKPRPSKRGGPNAEQIKQILEKACDYRRLHLMIVAYTGMRSEEFCRLRGEDIDTNGGWIHIVSRTGGKTKTGLSRKVPIHPHLVSALRKLRLAKGKLVFTSPPSKQYPNGGSKLKSKHLNEALARVLIKLGLTAGRKNDGFVVHSFRHAFRILGVNAGVPERVIDEWLGHVGDRSMGNTYYRLSDEESQRFIKIVPFIEPSFLRIGPDETNPSDRAAPDQIFGIS